MEIGAPNSWVSRFTISTAIDLKMGGRFPSSPFLQVDIDKLRPETDFSFGRTATAVRPKEIGAPNSWVSRFTISTAIDLKMERKVPLPLHFHIDIVNLETSWISERFGRTATAVRPKEIGAPNSWVSRFTISTAIDLKMERKVPLPLHY